LQCTHTYTHTHTHTHTHTLTHKHTHTHTHTRARARAHTHTRTHAHKHTHTHTRTRARTHLFEHLLLFLWREASVGLERLGMLLVLVLVIRLEQLALLRRELRDLKLGLVVCQPFQLEAGVDLCG
jgi:hypothetical protein